VKPQIALAPLFAVAIAVTAPAFSQQTGVSRPPESTVADLPIPAPAPAKPSAAIPAVAAPAAAPAEEYGAYRPYNSSGVTLRPRVEEKADPDAGIVTDVPRQPNQLPTGTAMHIRMHDEITTETTQPGTRFTAELTEEIVNEGRVVMPIGSTVEGRITQVRGGKRIHGTALIHLQAETIVLPDGTRMPLRAVVIDTDQYANTRIDEEGNILRKDHVGATLAAMSLTTGGAAAAGGVVGGVPGALIGAGVGAGLSTAWWLKQDRQTHLPQGTIVVLSLTEPMDIGQSRRPSEFSSAPAVLPTASTATAEPAAAPYVAPQAFVPTN
jgi:hypothetical protein